MQKVSEVAILGTKFPGFGGRLCQSYDRITCSFDDQFVCHKNVSIILKLCFLLNDSVPWWKQKVDSCNNGQSKSREIGRMCSVSLSFSVCAIIVDETGLLGQL